MLTVSVCRYGLGMIYYKQEKFNLAEIHFKKALSINPQSSVLLCHIGVVSPPLTQTQQQIKSIFSSAAAAAKILVLTVQIPPEDQSNWILCSVCSN